MPDKKLRLWDGRNYDIASLEASHPELVKYAQANECLQLSLSISGIQTYPLSDCCWFRGRASDDVAFTNTMVNVPAILLVPPGAKPLVCGLDDSDRARWQSFLEAAGVRRVLRTGGVVGSLLWLTTAATSVAAGFGAWHAVNWLAPMLHQFLPPALVVYLPLIAAVVWIWGTFMAIYLVVPGWYRADENSQKLLHLFAVFLPWVIFGFGRRGLGIAVGGTPERLAIMLLLAGLLWTLTRMLFRHADRRLKISRELASAGHAK